VPIVLSLLAFLLLAAPAQAGSWRRPVDGALLRAFDVGANPYAAGQHRGVDLAAPLGAAVRSVCSGRVSFTGRLPGGGLTVSTRCGALIATYQHLATTAVSRGQTVVAGARLGTVGRSGRPRAPAPHVHLGVREAASGRYLDPLGLFGVGSPGLPPVPGPGPRRRPPLLGPAPAPRLGPAPARLPRPHPDARPAFEHGPSGVRLPWTVWAGLGCVGLGLPLGGFVRLRRHRRATAVGARVARSA
jgi:murein DD-endopeptidase MepM/ murein hydrolase activator NlpD